MPKYRSTHLHCKLSHIGSSHGGTLASCQDAHCPDVHASCPKCTTKEHTTLVQVCVDELFIRLWIKLKNWVLRALFSIKSTCVVSVYILLLKKGVYCYHRLEWAMSDMYTTVAHRRNSYSPEICLRVYCWQLHIYYAGRKERKMHIILSNFYKHLFIPKYIVKISTNNISTSTFTHHLLIGHMVQALSEHRHNKQIDDEWTQQRNTSLDEEILVGLAHLILVLAVHLTWLWKK